MLLSACASTPLATLATTPAPTHEPPVALPEATSFVSCAELHDVIAPMIARDELDTAREALAGLPPDLASCVVVDLLAARIAWHAGDAEGATRLLDRAALEAGAEMVRADRIATALLEPGEAGARDALLYCDDVSDDAASLVGCASAALRTHDLRRAEDWLVAAVQMDPSSFAARMLLGDLRIRQRAFEDARGLLDEAVALRPTSYDARLALGAAACGAGDLVTAEAAYAAAIELAPTRPEAHLDLAMLLHFWGNGTEATRLRAAESYWRFVQLAEPAHAELVAEVTRRCGPLVLPRAARTPAGRQRAMREHRRCSPGLIQSIEDGGNEEMAQMQADVEAMMRQRLEQLQSPSP